MEMKVNVFQDTKTTVVVEREGDFFKITRLDNQNAYLMVKAEMFRSSMYKYESDFKHFLAKNMPSEGVNVFLSKEASEFIKDIINFNRIEF